MRVGLVVVAASLTIGACRDRPAGAPAAATASVRIFTNDEIAASRQALAARLAATAARTCPRPPLQAPPEVVNSTPSSLADVDGATDGLGACLDDVKALTARGKLPELMAAGDAELLALAGRCGRDLVALMASAIQDTTRCSPFQVGVGVARDPVRLTWASYLVAAEVTRPTAPTDLGLLALFQLIRFAHDQARGRVTLVPPMLAAAVTSTALDAAAQLLARTPTTTALPPEFDAMVAALLDGAPRYADMLQGEVDSLALYGGAALVEAPGWVPPGGWPPGEGAPRAEPDGPDPRDQGALMLANAAALAARDEAACPPTASLKACHDGLAAAAAADEAARVDADLTSGDTFAELVAATIASSDGAELRATLRRKLLAAMQAVQRPNYAAYVSRYAASVAGLAMLRVALAAHQARATTGRCPTAVELDAPPWATLLAPPVLGDRLVVTVGPDAIELAPPAWAVSKRPPWRIACVPPAP